MEGLNDEKKQTEVLKQTGCGERGREIDMNTGTERKRAADGFTGKHDL